MGTELLVLYQRYYWGISNYNWSQIYQNEALGAFLFFLKAGYKFITVDIEDPKKPFFSIKLNNQFMTFPKLNIKVSPIGSEFFSGVI